MALKALMLRKKIDQKKKELEDLRSVDFATREADLAKAIEEAETDEERSAVESEIDSFESDKKANADAVTDLERELGELEEQLAEEERAQNTEPVKEPEEERKGVKDMPTVENRNRFGVSEEFVTRENVAEFLLRVRDHMSQKRALTNVGLTIPTEIIGLIRENVMRYSKLYRHVNTRYISGEGRMIVQGTVPEAVWTECCATLNELSLTFNDVEVECNKLGG